MPSTKERKNFMNELETKIFDAITHGGQYVFSPDSSVKSKEIEAFENLEKNGYIRITAKALGFYVAEVL